LCAEKLSTSAVFYEHVANHLEQLALFLVRNPDCESEETEDSDSSDSQLFKIWLPGFEMVKNEVVIQELNRILPSNAKFHISEFKKDNGILGRWITGDQSFQTKTEQLLRILEKEHSGTKKEEDATVPNESNADQEQHGHGQQNGAFFPANHVKSPANSNDLQGDSESGQKSINSLYLDEILTPTTVPSTSRTIPSVPSLAELETPPFLHYTGIGTE
jgi:hypothetical protein